MASKPGIEVEGLDNVRRNLKALDRELPRGLSKVHKEIAEPVAEEARSDAPARTGRLAGSVRATGNQRGAQIVAGGARARYAPVIHWGWPQHNIEPQPFLADAMTAAAPDIADEYETLIMAWVDSVWIAS